MSTSSRRRGGIGSSKSSTNLPGLFEQSSYPEFLVGTWINYYGSSRTVVVQNTEHYRYFLGLELTWKVVRKTGYGKPESECLGWPCRRFAVVLSSVRRDAASLYSYARQNWSHLDSCQFKILLPVRQPLDEYKKKRVRQMLLTLAEDKMRSTALFEKLAIELLGAEVRYRKRIFYFMSRIRAFELNSFNVSSFSSGVSSEK